MTTFGGTPQIPTRARPRVPSRDSRFRWFHALNPQIYAVPRKVTWENLVEKKALTNFGTGATALTGRGEGSAITYNVNQSCFYNLKTASGTQPRQTYAWLGTINNLSASSFLGVSGDGNAAGVVTAVVIATSGAVDFWRFGFAIDSFTALTMVINVPYFLIVSHNAPGSSLTAWMKNLNTGLVQVQTISSGQQTSDASFYSFGSRHLTGLEGESRCTTWMHAYLRGAVTEAHARRWLKDPFGPYRKRVSRFYPVDSGGGITGTSAVALPLSGQIEVTVGIAGTSSVALPLGGASDVDVGVSASSVVALGLGGASDVDVEVKAASTVALPLAGSVDTDVEVKTTSSVALPLGGQIDATVGGFVGIDAQSNVALPLQGASTAVVPIVATSNVALPLGGSATAVAPISASSVQALPLSGAITTVVPIVATSTVAVPLSGAVTTGVLVTAASNVALPLTGMISVTSAYVLDSNVALPLGGSASASVSITAVSNVALPLIASGQVTIAITAQSNVALPLAGAVSITVSVIATSIVALPLSGSSFTISDGIGAIRGLKLKLIPDNGRLVLIPDNGRLTLIPDR